MIHKRHTALEPPVKYFTGGFKPGLPVKRYLTTYSQKSYLFDGYIFAALFETSPHCFF